MDQKESIKNMLDQIDNEYFLRQIFAILFRYIEKRGEKA